MAIWKSVRSEKPPSFDPEQNGWDKDEVNLSLVPKPLPDDQEYFPESLRNLVKCNCQAESPCKNGRCSCFKKQVRCSVFCGCNQETCNNKSPRVEDAADETLIDQDLEEVDEEEDH